MQVCSAWGVCVCVCVCARAKLLQSRWIICDTMDYSSPGSYVRDFSGKKTGVGFHAPLQGIFPTQGMNPSVLHWHVDSSPLSYLGSSWMFNTTQFLENMMFSLFLIFYSCK